MMNLMNFLVATFESARKKGIVHIGNVYCPISWGKIMYFNSNLKIEPAEMQLKSFLLMHHINL